MPTVLTPCNFYYLCKAENDTMYWDWVLTFHVFLTFYLTGVIWFVQIVHYPLMAKVGPAHFKTYEESHTWLTTWVVGPQMVAELSTGLLLLVLAWQDPWHWVNIFFLAVIWLSTFLIQSPLHSRLIGEFKTAWHQKLVKSNWIRTIAWTARSLILIWLLL